MNKIVIPLRFIDLEEQTVVAQRQGFLELYPGVLRYRCEMDTTEPTLKGDLNSGWSDSSVDFDTFVARESVVAVEIAALASGNTGVYVVVSGMSNDLKVFTRTRKKAEEIAMAVRIWRWPELEKYNDEHQA